MRTTTIWIVTALLTLMATPEVKASGTIPTCRLDDRLKLDVVETLTKAARVFDALSKELPFKTISVNSSDTTREPETLRVYIVRDAAQSAVGSDGCWTGDQLSDRPLDALSVQGGCVTVSTKPGEIRCSSRAVEIFSASGRAQGALNPSLLYVLAHELAHLLQMRSGEFSGRVEQLSLTGDTTSKVSALRRYCDPVLLNREEEADAIAFMVMTRLLPSPPYRQPILSERGSVYWNIDRIALAANSWQKLQFTEGVKPPPLHQAFVPTEFPTPTATISRQAKRFVCDVLSKRRGTVVYPARSSSHPPIEQRLRRVAETLKPVPDNLPASGGHLDFQPIVKLQGDLGPIFTHIYRETGLYMEALEDRICTLINAPKPEAACP